MGWWSLGPEEDDDEMPPPPPPPLAQQGEKEIMDMFPTSEARQEDCRKAEALKATIAEFEYNQGTFKKVATEEAEDLGSMKKVVEWWSSNTDYKPPSHEKFDKDTKKAMKVNKTFDKYKIEPKELSAEKKAKELESSLKWLQDSVASYSDDIAEFEYNQGTFKKVNDLFGQWTPKGTTTLDYYGYYDPREDPKDAENRAKDLRASLGLVISGTFDTNHPNYNCSVINRLKDLFADWKLKEDCESKELEDSPSLFKLIALELKKKETLEYSLSWWKLNASSYDPLTASAKETDMFLQSKKMLAIFGLKECDEWDKRNKEMDEALSAWNEYNGSSVNDLDDFTVGKMKKVKDALLQLTRDNLEMPDMKDMAKDMDDVLSWYLDNGYKVEDLSKVDESYKSTYKKAQSLMSLWEMKADPSPDQLKEIAESLITLRRNEYNPEIFNNPEKFDSTLGGDAGAKFQRLQKAMIDWRMKGAESDTITSDEGDALVRGMESAMDWWVANGEKFDFETTDREELFMAQMVKNTLDMWIPLGPKDAFTYNKSRDAVDEIKEVLDLYRDSDKSFNVSSLKVKSEERASLLKLKEAMLEWRRGNATNLSKVESEQTVKEMISAMNWWKKKGKDYDVVADRMETVPVMLRHKEVTNALEEFHEDFGGSGQTPFKCLSRKEQKKVAKELDESVSWWKWSGKKIDTTQAEEDFEMFGKAQRLSHLWSKANMTEDEREKLCEEILSDIAWLRKKNKSMDLDSVPGDKPKMLRELFKTWDSPLERSTKATAKDIEGAVSWWRGMGFAPEATSAIRSDNEKIEKLVRMIHQYSDIKNKDVDPTDMGWFRKEIIKEISNTLESYDADAHPKTDFAAMAPVATSDEQKRAQEMSSAPSESIATEGFGGALDWLRQRQAEKAPSHVDEGSTCRGDLPGVTGISAMPKSEEEKRADQMASALDWIRSNDVAEDMSVGSALGSINSGYGSIGTYPKAPGADDSQAPTISQAAKKDDVREDDTECIGSISGQPMSAESEEAKAEKETNKKTEEESEEKREQEEKLLKLATLLMEWKHLIAHNQSGEIQKSEFKKQWVDHPEKEGIINWYDDSIAEGRTMLHCAIKSGRLDIAKLLLEHGADPNIASNLGMTALMYACLFGHVDLVELLLDKGADIKSTDKRGHTALMFASIKGKMTIVEHFLNMGADLNIADEDGNTALMNASFGGHTSTAELLLNRGADFNVANTDGNTALTYACRKRRTKIVEILLTKGADLDIADKDGKAALAWALKEGHTKIVEVFMEKGADFKTVNEDGNTALINASRSGHTDMVRLLVDKGADLNIADKDGNTALTLAFDREHTDIVDLLSEKGADPSVCDKNGQTLLHRACLQNKKEGAQKVLEIGTDKNLLDGNDHGHTALFYAAEKGYADIVELLAKHNADVNKTDERTFQSDSYFESGSGSSSGSESGSGSDSEETSGSGSESGSGSDSEETSGSGSESASDSDSEEISGSGSESASGSGSVSSSPSETRPCSVKDGRTPLFVAAQNGHTNAVATLLQYGADPYLCNNNNEIPEDVSRVHGSIQQLFRIHDFFDKREKGCAYKTRYLTCEDIKSSQPEWMTKYLQIGQRGRKQRRSGIKKLKKPVPPIEDIIHDIVGYPHFANKFFELYRENRDIVNWLDTDGRTVQQVACRECREAILFMGQYDIDVQPIYESPTCTIYNALDFGRRSEPNVKPRKVAMKFMRKEVHFLNEIRTRRSGDGSRRFDSKYVTPDLAAYRADQDPEYAKACRTWKTIGSETEMFSDYCLVMPLAERSLVEAMDKENLSAPHKDFQRREILLTLCQIFSYLHKEGYVHGDIKPHNVVRHMDGNVIWKAIDFDACTKIGDVVGLKLTTGSTPPEMLKIIQSKEAGSSGKAEVVLRQPGGDLDESDLVKAAASFDVWSYGILMYQLVTNSSFFHCDGQGNVVAAGVQEWATLTQHDINEKLASVDDVNARLLLSRILRVVPEERPSMLDIEKDYYFHPSESPQGRKADFIGKQVFSIFVPQVRDSETEKTASTSLEPPSQIDKTEQDDDDGSEQVEELERYLSFKSEFSYFELRDEDKDWSDKLLNSEVETFQFDKLDGMGKKPKFIDGDTIYKNRFLRDLLSKKGPDYFMGFLVEYFELYKIMSDAHEVCQGSKGIKANLVSDVKSLKGIFIKLFVRGKGLNDIVRGTLFCNSVDQFKYVGRQLKEQYGHNVYIKPPKQEPGAWPIPKLLIYGNKRIDGRCMSVEIQFSTIYMHLALHASNNHLVYEAMRESTDYLEDKDKDFLEFIQSLNQKHIDTEGFLRNQSAEEGRFEVLVEKTKTGDEDGGESDKEYTTKSTGFILSDRVRCRDRMFRFLRPENDSQKFSESSFVVNKSLTLLSSHSYWSEESYELEGKSVEFVVSFKGRGLAIAGIGTATSVHGRRESVLGGARCSVHVARSKFVVRKNGVEEEFREKKLPNQERAKIIFTMKEGTLLVSFIGSGREKDEEVESVQLSMPSDQRYYLYMRAPPGVHDVKFHDVNIL